MAQQAASVLLNDTAVVDAKPLRTLTPMFPAPLGLHTFTPQNSPSFVCVTPFGPYAGGTEGMPAGVPPMFAAPAAPSDPSQRQPNTINMNGAAHANGTANSSLVTPSLQTPPSAATQESGKRKRGRPKRVPDTTVPSAPSVPLVPTIPPVPSLPLVPSVPSALQEGNNAVLLTPSATSQESGKRKRGRPKRLQNIPVLSTPSAPQADSTPVLQTLPAPTVHESGTRKRGRPKRVQDSSNTSTPIHLKDSEPTFQTPAATSPESSKRRGRPKCVPDASVTLSSHSGFSIDDDTVNATKRGRPRKIGTNLLQLPSLSSDDPRESADNVLMMFDALRRRLMQLDEVKQAAKQQHNLKAGSIMINAELRVNKNKRIGEVPGVEVGDMFYFRIEMCLVGLNSQSMAGIDYMSAKFGNEEDPVAISIVSAGVYDNTEDDPDVLVYTGQGMSGKDDQKLERGNLALERSLHRGNPIRVIRSVRDLTCPTGKIYIYDGLYKIKEAWVEKGKSGFNVFKHKLLREPGQPDGIAVWKKTEKWRENPSSRDHVILHDISYGMESKPVCLVNEVDDEKGPSHFTYTTKLNYENSLSSMRKMQGCKCASVCLPGDNNCSCTHRNAGDLPYSASGILVSRMPMLYECNDSCTCSHNCRNRVVQKGTQIHFEVFKTGDRGWGLRSWDPIRAGTFICEYAGEIIAKNSMNGEGDYIFETPSSELNLRWNYAPELLGEPSLSYSNETTKQLPSIISAKRSGNIARFMNHSCSPNVFWQPVLYDHGDEGYPHIAFFAIKHIPPMTELTYDYGQSQDNIQLGTNSGCRKFKNCLCWSRKCRGSFG
ncbi:histone-lysine N-methyltransferase, H3 lysine-9 specific SUVH1-like [Phragmites australis]|uniref:histone-lysine N-methyltransferase, H3 lysine-9 specific SUVH1-like n=1 Tax=Phragmites australis TaxID=29695 RepID=UPI002D78602E|nr:histone-lysine N-methyltransferase, H3 lysine-9 specific SUVH1-like [Phragmites australis]XP_062189040.1 histone-lysine N-methyltransferase, H3 lysine-9 specific SUVH1-like [Phragmites australis]XP_062189041.1 histone-lysine N-methyltransferase, H3 lysine-9 specific SUVH1-like [Phragmites australis]XP_062189042.1 histone-lysine N-methyltransferase, H3 lysine-9 specific SUVH1-like [Phragmites australis]XP_062189043.1 histone-lysine N-methyltransferase, H3 lysine-9 specific SUVH1-like [Phragmi